MAGRVEYTVLQSASASTSPQGFTTSTTPFTARGAILEPGIPIATADPSTAGPSSIVVALSKDEQVDGVYKKQQTPQDPKADGSNLIPSVIPLGFNSHPEEEPRWLSTVSFQFFRLFRDWSKLLSRLTRPCKRWTRSERHLQSYINVAVDYDDDEDDQQSKNIPRYILDYAPLVHLSSHEQFWPCDVTEHLLHVDPYFDYTLLRTSPEPLNLTNLDQLNKWDNGRHIYIQSKDDVETRPEWLSGRENIPSDSKIERPGAHGSKEGGAVHIDLADQAILGQDAIRGRKKSDHGEAEINTAGADLNGAGIMLGGRSRAPATLIVLQKENGIVDAFWFFFYSYNLGNQVVLRFGNHVADWEYTLVRFEKGKPKAVYYSEHSFGEAYSYETVEKIGNRPVTYSAIGTHAMYPNAGIHRYILPLGILHDTTDRGPLWDPSLNVRMYAYDHHSNQLSPGNLTPDAPIEWFYYNGHWGDKAYPLSDPRQYRFAGQYHYVDGPVGPRFKNLGRKEICEHYRHPCIIKDKVDGDQIRRWPGTEEGEDLESGDAR